MSTYKRKGCSKRVPGIKKRSHISNITLDSQSKGSKSESPVEKKSHQFRPPHFPVCDQIIYECKIKNQLIYNQAKYHELELVQKRTDFRLLSTLDIKVS